MSALKNISGRSVSNNSYRLIGAIIEKKCSLINKYFMINKENIRIPSHGSILNPKAIVDVPTSQIRGMISPSISKYKYNFDLRHVYNDEKKSRVSGIVLGGFWDLGFKNIEGNIEYKVFQERYLIGKEWEDTYVYDKYIKYRKNNKTKGRYAFTECWEDYKKKYLEYWDKIYLDIKENGYKRQSNIKKNNLKSSRREGSWSNEIEVCVSRYGDIMLRDGKHRLYIAKTLDIKQVPVIVNVWHREIIDLLINNNGELCITPNEAINSIV